MKTLLLILGKETNDFAKGAYNQGLFDAAVETLKDSHEVLTTVIEDGYGVPGEIAKFKKADAVIYQYPVYWFMMPSSLKRYMDEVYAYNDFFAFNDGPYGTGGLMKGRKFMLSTTWNAPLEAFNDPDGFFEGRSVADVLLPMRKDQEYCGLQELPHFSCHDIVKAPRFEADRERYVRHLKSVFPRAANTPRPEQSGIPTVATV
jgi:modulator of drug activity B